MLETFLKTLVPDSYDRITVAERRTAMEAALARSTLRAGRWFESGSWSHGTSLKGHSDVDFMARATGPRPDRPSSALASLKTTLSGSHWAITSLRISSPTVKIGFYSAPNFEVVPAWLAKTVGGDEVFWIPGPDDSWAESAPAAHLRFVTQQNDRLSKKVKPLARLLKAWKVYTGAPVSSFYLEMRVAEYAKNERFIHYHTDLLLLMHRLIDYGVRSMNDPTGLVSRINAVSSEDNRRTTLRLLRAAVNHLELARDLERTAEGPRYREAMRALFGPSFPYPTR